MEKNKKQLPVYNMIIDEDNQGVFAISLVDSPAMEDEFIMFNDMINTDDLVRFKSIDDEEQMIIGLVMEPEKRIYRRTSEGFEYELVASKDVVKKSAHYFLKNNNQNNVTLQHEKEVSGISVVESWVVRDSKKDLSYVYGKKYPVGSWVVIMKVNDRDKWLEFKKSGTIKGFSLEGKYTLDEVQFKDGSKLKTLIVHPVHLKKIIQ
jgi:ribosomal protein L21E